MFNDYSTLLVIDPSTPANCGTISESFTELNYADMSPFAYDTSTKTFKILYNEDESKARIYQIEYTAQPSYLPPTEAQSETFFVTITDPCVNPISLNASTFQANHQYTIT